MIWQIKRLFERVGDRQEIDCAIPLEELREARGCESIVTPISIKGRIINRGGMVSLDYTSAFTVRHLCDYSLQFEHILTREESPDDGDDVYYCPGCALDLNELAVSDLLVELPTKVLCRSDCRGLCPKCGRNLNLGDCGCTEE